MAKKRLKEYWTEERKKQWNEEMEKEQERLKRLLTPEEVKEIKREFIKELTKYHEEEERSRLLTLFSPEELERIKSRNVIVRTVGYEGLMCEASVEGLEKRSKEIQINVTDLISKLNEITGTGMPFRSKMKSEYEGIWESVVVKDLLEEIAYNTRLKENIDQIVVETKKQCELKRM